MSMVCIATLAIPKIRLIVFEFSPISYLKPSASITVVALLALTRARSKQFSIANATSVFNS